MTEDKEQELSRLRVSEQIREILEGLLKVEHATLVSGLNSIKAQLDIIEAQVTKTNGRVTLLEIWKAQATSAFEVLAAVKTQMGVVEGEGTKTNNRVTLLEVWKAQSTSVLAALILVAGFIGWFLNWAMSAISALKP